MTDSPDWDSRTLGFHARDGWHFLRLEDGSVEVSKRMPTYDRNQRFNGYAFIDRVVLTPNEWASVICSMSAMGETGATFQLANDFHAGHIAQTGHGRYGDTNYFDGFSPV